jgi:hypothetical protein
MVRGPLVLGLLICASLGLPCAGCVQSSQNYPLRSALAGAQGVRGSVSVERVEGGQRLVAVELHELPAPERLGPGLTEFVLWLKAPSGSYRKAGALAYDRTQRSGSLLATTTLAAFTLQVTGERGPGVTGPSDVLLTEREISIDGSRAQGSASADGSPSRERASTIN